MTSRMRYWSSCVLACAIVATTVSVPASAQNATNGEDIFKKCRACHDVGPEAKNRVGPALRGVFGRKAGTVDGFNYSDAMRAAGTGGLEWSDTNVEKYLADPRGFIPGNKMAFPGLKDDAERKDLIAFLKASGS